MKPSTIELSEITLINESQSERVPGDISLFQSASEACRYLEPWWVENGEGFVLAATGQRLVLGVNGDRVVLASREYHPAGEHLVDLWLNSAASAVRIARGDEAPLPVTTRDLIAYIGFDR